VNTNPLPNHGAVNVLSDDEGIQDHSPFIGPPDTIVAVTVNSEGRQVWPGEDRSEIWKSPLVRKYMKNMDFDPDWGNTSKAFTNQ